MQFFSKRGGAGHGTDSIQRGGQKKKELVRAERKEKNGGRLKQRVDRPDFVTDPTRVFSGNREEKTGL